MIVSRVGSKWHRMGAVVKAVLSAWNAIENEYRVLLEEASEREDDAGVAFDEAAVEVGEAEEGLEVSDRLRLWPGEDGVDLGGCHGYAVVGDDESEELGRGFGELAFLRLGIESIGDESTEDFADVFRVPGWVVGEDEDVVEVDEDGDVQDVAEDVVHEVLE